MAGGREGQTDVRVLLEVIDELLELYSYCLSRLAELYQRRWDAIRVLMKPEELARLAEGMSDEDAGKLFKALMSLSRIASSISSLGSLEPDDIMRLREEVERVRRVVRSELGG